MSGYAGGPALIIHTFLFSYSSREVFIRLLNRRLGLQCRCPRLFDPLQPFFQITDQIS